jgi:putative RecB family exonuclease
MTYHLSASKLQTYSRCPKSYHFRYELGLRSASFFGAAGLGTALHKTLEQIYGDWHYQAPLPEYEWIESCWLKNSIALTMPQVQEGREILQTYYQLYMVEAGKITKPLALESRIQGTFLAENVEFTLTGRCDRLDWLDDGLELIDYKSAKAVKLPDPEEVDLQIGLYYLALEQRYHQSLKQLSLIFLRSGEKVVFPASEARIQKVRETIGEIALRLRSDRQWQPCKGDHCKRCSYARYCSAVKDNPDPLPEEEIKPKQQLQLTLSL